MRAFTVVPADPFPASCGGGLHSDLSQKFVGTDAKGTLRISGKTHRHDIAVKVRFDASKIRWVAFGRRHP
jgi:hypothetical protein